MAQPETARQMDEPAARALQGPSGVLSLRLRRPLCDEEEPSAEEPLGFVMTTAAKLLARKRLLLDRLDDEPGPNERVEIADQLQQIDTALDLLEETGPRTGDKGDKEE